MATKKSTQTNPQGEAIFGCIQAAFKAQGLNAITSPLDQIVWHAIPKAVIIKVGASMRKCIKAKVGKDPGDLTGPLLVLGAHQPVMTVATLIADLQPLVS